MLNDSNISCVQTLIPKKKLKKLKKIKKIKKIKKEQMLLWIRKRDYICEHKYTATSLNMAS